MAITTDRLYKFIIFTLLFLVMLMPMTTHAQDAVDVSVVSLIANPLNYDGKKIRVIGFAKIGYEWHAIYLSKEDAINGITKNAIRLILTKKETGMYIHSNDHFVVVEGVFDGQFKSFADSYSGAIKKISRIDNWSVQSK